MAGTTALVGRPEPPLPPPPRRRPWPLWSRVLVWLAVLVVAALAGSILSGQSSIRAASLRTAEQPPQLMPVSAPPAEPATLWQADSDGPAPPTVAEGSVVLTSQHGVAAHDLVTGEERWHYTRSDATLCAAHPSGATVVAVFRTGERCDEAIGLDPGTGHRTWYRSVNLSPDAEFRGSTELALATTPTGLLGIEAYGGSTRFRYRPPDTCSIADANAGQLGVVLVQSCQAPDQPVMASLVGLSSVNGEQEWSIPLASPDSALLAADTVAAVGVPTVPPGIQIYGRDGEAIAALSDPALPAAEPPVPPGTPPSVALAVAHALVWNGQQIAVVGFDSGTLLWNAPSTAAPNLSGQEVTVLQGGNQLIRLSLLDGTELGRSTVDTDLSGTTLTRAGATFVAVNGGAVTVFG